MLTTVSGGKDTKVRLIVKRSYLFFYSWARQSCSLDYALRAAVICNTSDILYTWDGKYLYKGRFTNTSDILYTFDGKHLYRGRFTNTSDILLTFGAPVPVIIMLLNTI